jgi:hypothetical protein
MPSLDQSHPLFSLLQSGSFPGLSIRRFPPHIQLSLLDVRLHLGHTGQISQHHLSVQQKVYGDQIDTSLSPIQVDLRLQPVERQSLSSESTNPISNEGKALLYESTIASVARLPGHWLYCAGRIDIIDESHYLHQCDSVTSASLAV